MMISDITEKVNHLTRLYDEERKANDERLGELERKGAVDPLLTEKMGRIADVIDQQKSRLDRLETAANRPGGELAGSPVHGAEAGEYKAAFRTYLRKGMDAGLEAFESQSLAVSTNSGADGGYLVTPQMAETIVQIVHEISPMRELANVTTISTDSLDVIEDTELPGAEWLGETTEPTENTTHQINKNTIPVFEMAAIPQATQKLIDDASVDVEAWIAQKVGQKFAALEATAFISGNGTSAPKGILSYASGTSFGQIERVNSGTDAAVTADGLINLFYALKDEYAKNATFLMNRSVIQAVRLLKESTTDQYLWQPGLAAGAPDTLLGVPVRAAADMPAASNGSLSVAVGDFKRAYQIVDRTGIRILRDPFTSKPYVKFFTTRRVGGEVVNTEAVKILALTDGV